MVVNPMQVLSPEHSRIPYAISVEQLPNSNWLAQVLGWQDCRVEALSRDSAIDQLKQALNDRLAKTEVIFVDLPVSETENPWMKHAGIFKDDPQFDEMLEDIATHRKELDAKREEMRD
jgi:hypothetical protein